MSSSSEIITNLQNQIKLYQQMFEQLENNSDTLTSDPTSASVSNPLPVPIPVPTPNPTSTSIQNIFKLKKKYIKSIDILNLFKFTKAEYNNILVNINKVILKFYFTYLIFFIFSLKFVFV